MAEAIVVVGGAGRMGRRAVRALVEGGHRVIVADRVAPDGEGFEFAEIDAAVPSTMARVFDGAAVVMNFAGPFYEAGPVVLETAINAGRPYLDICDDADATELLLGLDEQARERGVPAIVGAGMSPGVVNAVAVVICRGLEQIDELVLTWVVAERSAGGVAPLQHYFHCIDEQIPVWEDGKRTLIDAFSPKTAEVFPFPDPVGPIEVREVGHPETVTLPRVLQVASVRNKGAILPESAAKVFELLKRIGLLSTETVEIAGAQVPARDFVAHFLQERHNRRARSGEDRSALGVRVSGRIGEQAVRRRIGFARQMLMADSTALPAVAAVPQLLDNPPPPGVHGPEALDSERWFAQLDVEAAGLFEEFHLYDDADTEQVLSLSELASWQPA